MTENKWQSTLEILKGQMTKGAYTSNFSGTSASLNGSNQLIIYTPSSHALDWIQNRLMAVLTRAVNSIYGEGVTIALQENLLPDQVETKPVEKPKDAFRIRDRRGNNRYYIDNIFLRQGYGAAVGPYGIAIYNAICLHADYDYQDCWPSHKLLADLTGMSNRQARYKIKELEDLGVIEVERRREGKKNLTNVVTLTAVSEWKII